MSSAEEVKLLPCPFCGVVPTLREHVSSTQDETYGYAAIECLACDRAGSRKSYTRFCGVHGDDEADVIAAWNHRADLTAARAQIASAREALAKLTDAAENLVIAMDMGWDLEGVVGALVALLPAPAAAEGDAL